VKALVALRHRLTTRPRRPVSRIYRTGDDGEVLINQAAREFSAMTGPSNPVAPPMELWLDEDAARGRIRFGRAYEGHPGHVHGGYLATAFDELFGKTYRLSSDGPVVTGTLTVRYRKPAPLEVPFEFEGRVAEVRGRKILLQATCHADGVLIADAEALFVLVSDEHYETLLENGGASE
jgi:acyl-coenzyme A thioesterase PaaI-like protein